MKISQDAKKVFRECGTCSQTFAHILNREFDHPKKTEEIALDPLAGGIMNQGQQCGMLWGAALAVGAESFRRHQNTEQAIAVAITATQHLIDSFLKETDTVNCREIIGYDLTSTWGLGKFILKTTLKGMNNSLCFNLAEEWAPKAVHSAMEGLAEQPILNDEPVNCAAEVAKRMGANEEEMVMVSGFAGGLGLSGHGCGALSAAIWMKTLAWCKANPGETPPYLKNTDAKNILKAFKEVTDSEFICIKICGRKFQDINDHSEYIKRGGCEKIIDVLAQS